MLYLEYIASGVIFVRPTEPAEHGRHLVLPEHAEQSVQEDLESYGQRLATVQHQAGDVESHVRPDGFHGAVAQRRSVESQLVESCDEQKKTKTTVS